MTETRAERRERKRAEARGVEQFQEHIGDPAPLAMTPQAGLPLDPRRPGRRPAPRPSGRSHERSSLAGRSRSSCGTSASRPIAAAAAASTPVRMNLWWDPTSTRGAGALGQHDPAG